MAKTNAEKQDYRERKKLVIDEFIEKERKRQKKYYVKKKTKQQQQQQQLYGPFLWMGLNCLEARANSRRQFTFYH